MIVEESSSKRSLGTLFSKNMVLFLSQLLSPFLISFLHFVHEGILHSTNVSRIYLAFTIPPDGIEAT